MPPVNHTLQGCEICSVSREVFRAIVLGEMTTGSMYMRTGLSILLLQGGNILLVCGRRMRKTSFEVIEVFLDVLLDLTLCWD